MPHPFRNFEVRVLEAMFANSYSSSELTSKLANSRCLREEYTGYGFYISIENQSFGRERLVLSDPLLIGRGVNNDAAFVVFIEDSQLTLEIVPWNGEALPLSFRDEDVKLLWAADIAAASQAGELTSE